MVAYTIVLFILVFVALTVHKFRHRSRGEYKKLSWRTPDDDEMINNIPWKKVVVTDNKQIWELLDQGYRWFIFENQGDWTDDIREALRRYLNDYERQVIIVQDLHADLHWTNRYDDIKYKSYWWIMNNSSRLLYIHCQPMITE